MFTKCVSDNERSWLWFFDRIGTHYFSNYNNEVKAPITGTFRLQLIFRSASLDADAQVLFPTSSRIGLNYAC